MAAIGRVLLLLITQVARATDKSRFNSIYKPGLYGNETILFYNI